MPYSPQEKTILRQFGDAVHKRRIELGISQEDLGYLAGVDRSFVGKIERAENNVSLLKIARLARVLNVSLAQLLGDVAIPDDILDE